MTGGAFVLVLFLVLAWWVFSALERPEFLLVKVYPMSKQVGDTIVVTVAPVPPEAPVTDVAFAADASLFAFVHSEGLVATYTCLAPATGATVSASAKAADGSTVSGVSAPFDVAPKPVVATALTVTVA